MDGSDYSFSLHLSFFLLYLLQLRRDSGEILVKLGFEVRVPRLSRKGDPHPRLKGGHERDRARVAARAGDGGAKGKGR